MRFVPFVLFLAATVSGCAGAGSVPIPTTVPELRPGVLQGYLAPAALPNSIALLPAPPAEGSAARALDVEISESALALRGSPRWELAAADAVLRFPEAAQSFSCALDLPVTEQNAPNLYVLLRRSATDAGASTSAAKERYHLARPFMVNGEPSCAPADEAYLRNSGAYPSGHAAIGWAWALILTELAPERADTLLARGRAFAESRVVCNVHWESDVVEGRFMGAAAVARLHGDPVFRAQLELARDEVAKLHAAGARSERDCATEAAALGTTGAGY